MLDTAVRDAVRRALSTYLDVPPGETRLRAIPTNWTGFFGPRRHCRFVLTHRSRRFLAFGKIAADGQRAASRSVYGTMTPGPEAEYENLKLLERLMPRPQGTPTLVGLVRAGGLTICLFEYLEGFSNLSAVLAESLLRRPTARLALLADMGRAVLHRLYAWQPACSRWEVCTLDDELAALRRTLNEVSALLPDARTGFEVTAPAPAPRRRRGIIHGDLGPRNILVSGQDVTVVDWEGMQRDRLSLYDPCYFVASLVVRGVQLLLPARALRDLRATLMDQVRTLEAALDPDADPDAVGRDVGFAARLAEAHLLAAYGRDLQRRRRWSLTQRRRQVAFLLEHGLLARPSEAA